MSSQSPSPRSAPWAPAPAATILAWLGLCACGSRAPSEALAPSALLITLDTTRADALGCYGQGLATSPALDRLASEGMLFERASSTVPLTLPAHASILTGLYPLRHGIRVNGSRALPEEALSIAELARAAGAQTAAFVAASVLDASFGLDQGFDEYHGPRAHARGPDQPPENERPAVRVVSDAIAWLEARDPSRPFFLWVHLFDPHDPYEPPEPFRMGPEVHPYLGEIRATDAAVGGLMAWLDQRGLLAELGVVVVGDHGEALGQHGEITHGDYLYEPTVRVPLLVHGPSVTPARVTEVVSIVDVAPTLAELLELSWPTGTDGRSLLADPDPARGVYLECYTGYLSYGWSPLAGWRDANGKYLHSSQPSFFRTDDEPDEVVDRIEEVDVSAYRTAIARLSALPRIAYAEQGASAVDPQLAASVRALGYASAGADASRTTPDPLVETGLPAPQAMAAQHQRTLAALELAARGRFAEAEAELARTVAESPRHWAAWDRLAFCRFAQGDYAGALEALDALLVEREDLANAHLYRGRSLWELGRRAEAIEALERAATLEPDAPEHLRALAGALDELGREDEALPYLERLRRLEALSR